VDEDDKLCVEAARLLRAGDHVGSSQTLYQRWGKPHYSIALGSTRGDRARAEDIRQEWMVRVIRGIGSVRETDKVCAWARAIFKNVMIDFATRRPPEAEETDAVARSLRMTLRLWWAKECAALTEVERATLYYGAWVEDRRMTWADAAKLLNERFSEQLGEDAWRKRFDALFTEMRARAER
jgi:DNA-directed RNA polymerase specialized sigma24 family protein